MSGKSKGCIIQCRNLKVQLGRLYMITVVLYQAAHLRGIRRHDNESRFEFWLPIFPSANQIIQYLYTEVSEPIFRLLTPWLL
ncbi:hypothetical protein CEXT_309121 [Caerostris extrusa]|uniref:Uncharacterized protein n=1 Tax=Caerostris extrusa TaxID=172846 RepID=A0AAV4Q2Y5_CAEEX|nr:hypothetical protein CEXT_309121 [Caerostris extrusa]